MSVVVAIKDGERVVFGCDSQITKWHIKSTLIQSQMKIWKPSDDDNIIIGHSGAFRDGNIVSIIDGWIDKLADLQKNVNFKYMVTNIVPKLFSELEKYGRLKINSGIKSMESDFIFAYKSQIYIIESNGGVVEIDEFATIGSGSSMALGAWESIKNQNITIEEKAELAVKSACKNDIYVNYPIIIMNTKDGDVKILDK